MAFTIPDKGEGDNDLQSILFQEDLEVLVAGIAGIDCVLSGLDVTGGADMTPAVAKGAVLSNRAMFAVAAADVTIGTADATNPRIDLIVVNSSGALAVRAGTAAAAPKPPARTANDVVIASVYVPANDTAIATTQIKDRRVTPQFPIVVHKETATKTQANSAAAVSIFNTAPVIPNGLFLSGRALRVRAFGNWLHNTTTSCAWTLTISYGGTTIFADASLGSGVTADADRMAWDLNFVVTAQANNSQRMGGSVLVSPFINTAATTGMGDMANDELSTTSPIGSATGGIAVDSDAANRTLDITWTMSVANALHDWVCQGIIVELL